MAGASTSDDFNARFLSPVCVQGTHGGREASRNPILASINASGGLGGFAHRDEGFSFERQTLAA